MADKTERLGNFVLLERLNKGGMAEVYLAKSIGANGVNKFVAIKRILPEHSQRKEFIEMFKEEAKIAVNLSHQNVISAIDFKIENTQQYLVMDYLQGKNLREILVEKAKQDLKLLIPYIVHIIKEAAAGLDYAHNAVDRNTGMSLGLIHRDMSPQNIMISYQGEIKVIDFGIAKAENNEGESTQAGTLKGKYSYMSPEQAEGMSIDKTTDIFALGIILWELLADERLFQANNELNILKRVKECDIPELRKANPSIPLELDKITKKCLAKERSLRYGHASELYKDLARYLAREYPDFVPRDFGTFIQGIFMDDFERMQKKLREFSRVKIDDVGSDNQHTEVMPSMAGRTETVEEFESPKGMDPNAKPVDVNISEELSRTKNPKGRGLDSTRYPDSNPQTKSGTAAPSDSGTSATGATRTRIPKAESTSATRTQNPYKKKKKKQPEPQGLNFNFFMILIAAVAAGYFLVPNRLIQKWVGKKTPTAQAKQAVANNTPNPGDSPQAPTNLDEFATQGGAVVMIESKPERAEIYLNGKPTDLVTPARITVPINTDFEITLTKQGYINHVKRYKTGADGKISAALQSVPVGYVNINVTGLTAGAKVKVNGVTLPERPPIKRYPVPANTPIKIEVEDLLQNSTAETTITVQAEQKEDIILNLVPGKNNTGNIPQ